MNTNRQSFLIPFLFSVSFAASAGGLVAADQPRGHGDPPAVVQRALVDARAAAAAGDVEAAMAHVVRGLDGVAPTGRVRYQQARLEQWAVQWRDREVVDLLEAGDVAGARVVLQQLSAPLRSELARGRQVALERRIDAVAGAAEASSVERWRERRMANASKLLERADRELDRSRGNSRRTVAAARHAEVALRRYRAAERELLRLDAGDAPENVVALRERAAAGTTTAMLQIADAKTTQGNFRAALDWIDRVQQREPDNVRAAALRETVQLASAAATAWLGWPVVGGAAR